jgi:hypothetical protein
VVDAGEELLVDGGACSFGLGGLSREHGGGGGSSGGRRRKRG